MDLLIRPLPAVENIEFGQIMAPHFVTADYRAGKWSPLQVKPLSALELHPAAVVLHYGQAIFEGLKAYSRADGKIGLFRPEMNAARFIHSAERMLMPELPGEVFVAAAKEVVRANVEYVPPRPGTLYLRPTMIATEPCIGVRGANEFLFYILALPAGSYFKGVKEGAGAVAVYVSESVARAARGGTGAAKAAANYAITLKTIHEAKANGCAQVLFLDAAGKGRIEEMGGMNVFFLIDGRLVTPPLTDTILPGVTRDSILKAAPGLGVSVEERFITTDELRSAAASGALTEAFACGTAAVITGIKSFLFESGATIEMRGAAPGAVTSKLYSYLQDLQFGAIADTHGWTTIVD